MINTSYNLQFEQLCAALGLECADEAERQMGEEQAAETITQLRRCEENMEEILLELERGYT